MRLFRLVRIAHVVWRHGLDEIAISGAAATLGHRGLLGLARLTRLGRKLPQPRGQRLREALESLGPIFVKFGQVLSTRRDLVPPDLADELAKLQDRVPPFPAAQSAQLVERALGRPILEVFARFDAEPVASASIAQVHFAELKDGREVAVKVLRPGMPEVIEQDLTQYCSDRLG